MRRLWNALFLLGFLLAGCAPVGSAPTPAATVPAAAISDDQMNAVAHQLYCPICQNVSLDVCPTTACANWRELIRQKLAAGWSVQQIKDYFANQYGTQVLPEPPLQGFNWLAYLLPAALLAALAATGWSVAWRLRRKASAHPSAGDGKTPGPMQDAYVARLEEELRQRSQKE